MTYHSKFGNWDQRASVRVKPRHVLDQADLSGIYFPPELVPPAAHPLVASQDGRTRRLLTHTLYQYLEFTAVLESIAVIPLASRLSRRASGLDLPPAMRLDAHSIVVDEAWHARFSADLMAQVESATGVAPQLPPAPAFIDRLTEITARVEPDLRSALDILFAVVSETIISSLLETIPKDTRLPAAVRTQVADHAQDEGKHHAYFRALLQLFWPALSVSERRSLGALVPQLIEAFLSPDTAALNLALFDCGLSPDEAQLVLAESYPAADIREFAATAARSTVRYFTEVGALKDPRVHDAFTESGLIRDKGTSTQPFSSSTS